VALVLGLQPHIAHRPDGTPLFFPFGFGVTLPAIVIPHLVVGAGEGVLTVLVYQFVAKSRRIPG
jgi:cobalt/nickel transport system permease protein